MLRLKFREWFKLPSPKELGWSNSNALGMRDLISSNQQHTWEDWEEYVQKHYPIRYFFAKTVTDWFTFNIYNKVDRFFYWVKSHVIPSRRYHVLDLRQPKGDELTYRWGWIDAQNQMEFAIFNILNNFVANEMTGSHFYFPTEEDVAKDEYPEQLQAQRDNCLEIMAIHHWWNVDRKEEQKTKDNALDQWSENRRNGNKEAAEFYWNQMNELDIIYDAKEDEMMIRLIKIRKAMWT